MNKMKILYLGTPQFAVPMLERLSSFHEIVGVVTSPDKPHESDIKKYAKDKFKLFQPEKLKDETFLQQIKDLNADLFVVVAFRMLPEVLWKIPPLGTINLHASLLPKYRGAAPINWAIINGEEETGVTTFFINSTIDTGKIIRQDKISIGEKETVGELHDRLMGLGVDCLMDSLNNLECYEQSGEVTLAPKIFKDMCEINWNQPVDRVFDFIRGLSPYPCAYTKLQGKNLRIFKCEKGKGELTFPCSDGDLSVLECQLEGRKKMGIKEFLNGWKK